MHEPPVYHNAPPPFEVSDLEKRTPEENAEMRDEFDDKKADLKLIAALKIFSKYSFFVINPYLLTIDPTWNMVQVQYC